MSERHTEVSEWDKLAPRERAMLTRRLKLMDVAWPNGDPRSGIDERPFPVAANLVHELFRETDFGVMMPIAGQRLCRVPSDATPQEAFAASLIVKTLPDRSFFRVMRLTPNDDPELTDWRQTTGVVFHYDYLSLENKLVTGEVELGLALSGFGPITAYRNVSVYVDANEYAVIDPDVFTVKAAVVDQLVANMSALTTAAKFAGTESDLLYWGGVDVTGLPERFGDNIGLET